MDLGAGPWRTFRRVTFPLYVYGAFQRELAPEVNVMSTGLLLLSVAALAGSVAFQRRRLGCRRVPAEPSPPPSSTASSGGGRALGVAALGLRGSSLSCRGHSSVHVDSLLSTWTADCPGPVAALRPPGVH